MRHAGIRPTPRGMIARYIVLAILTVLFLLPFYVIVRNAFSTEQLIIAPSWRWLPNQLDGTNIAALFADQNLQMTRSMVNSTVVAIIQTSATLFVSLLAGYALARWHTRAARVIFRLTLFTLMVPAAVTFIPSFVMTSALGWIDSYRGLIIPVMWSAFATFLFRQSFLSFPPELEEAALIDGANQWTGFWRVVVPNSMGIVAAVGTITLIGSWNGFLWPMLVARDSTRTVQVTLSRFMTSQGVNYPLLFAGALVAVLPVLVVFLGLQRWLVQGTETAGLD